MRIIWKDSEPKTKVWQEFVYRGRKVTGYANDSVVGWVTDLPGDINIYFPRECAFNAIDIALGGKTRKANPKRHALGVKTIGTVPGKDVHICG